VPAALDADACYAALAARDSRFDGVFFVGVTTTGIYCRPICTARTPGRARCRFFRSPALAEKDGFRACFRCRPEVAPGGATVDAVSELARRALAAIDAGALNERSVDDVAADLGVSGRHLRRALEAELGVSPVELGQTRRLALAKQLLHDTALPLTDVALASGFGSVRRFNALFQDRFGRAPSSLRRDHAEPGGGGLELRLDVRPPYDWRGLVDFIGRRAIPGVEVVTERGYARVVRIGGAVGTVAIAPDRDRPSLRAQVAGALAPHVMAVAAMVRRLFDLDAHPDAIAASLGTDPLLGPLVARRPGLRLPGAADPFELGVRALLGQQVSVRAATTLAGRIVERFGDPVPTAIDGLSHAFPLARTLADASSADIAAIGLPGQRAEALRTFAGAIATGAIDLGSSADPESLIPRLVELPGIGEWTAQYIAMRALHHPDAFPASDLGIRKALGGLATGAARRRADGWRPWRSYAVMHLWASLDPTPPAGEAP
jgi:AraC family transcriptional regulator of adaptative response / DNA-3-methyladenine glycosylase II